MGHKAKQPDLVDVSIELKLNAKMMEKQASKMEA